jgi:hypothetical protein
VKRHARVILFLVGMPFFHTSRAVIGAGLDAQNGVIAFALARIQGILL